MSKPTFTNKAISRYLLGSLPEAETERLDELSITDGEFADALRAAENDLVDAYVQGELTGLELEQFKANYLASHLRREKVKFAQEFQALAEKNATAQGKEVQARKPAESVAKRKKSAWFSGLPVFSTQRIAWKWGSAFAALALIIVGAWVVFENSRLRQRVSETEARRDFLTQREQDLQKELEIQRAANATTEEQLAQVREERERIERELKKEQEQQRLAQPQRSPRQQQPSSSGGVSIASFILTPQMRGSTQLQTLPVPSDTDYVAMRLELEPNNYSAYQVALLDQSNNQILWRSSKLKASMRGEGLALDVRFRADLLKPQALYFLRASGISASGAFEIVGDYPFRVVK